MRCFGFVTGLWKRVGDSTGVLAMGSSGGRYAYEGYYGFSSI
jgi:hypothetical protein